AGMSAAQAFQLQPVAAAANFIAEQKGLTGAVGNATSAAAQAVSAALGVTQTAAAAAATPPPWPQESTKLAVQAIQQAQNQSRSLADFFGEELFSVPGLKQGQAFSFTLPNIAESARSLDIRLLGSDGQALPSWLHYDPLTHTLSGTPGAADVGAVRVTITLADASGEQVTRQLAIDIANVNDPPQFLNATPLDPSTLFVEASDPDPDTTLSITAPNPLPAWMQLIDHGDGTATLGGKPGPGDSGHYDIVLIVSDGVYQTRQTFSLDIKEMPNTPPVITSEAPLTVAENSAYQYTLTSSDPDTGNSLKYSAADLPTWLMLTDHGDGTATLSGTPGADAAGDYPIVLTLDDGYATTQQTWTLTVEHHNDAPVFTSTPPDKIAAGNAYRYAITLSDANPGDPLTITASTLPAWLQLTDQGNGMAILEGTPGSGDLGDFSLVLTGSDGEAQVEQTYTLTVALGGAPAEFTSTPEAEAREGQVYSYLIRYQDPNGLDGVRLTATDLPAWLTLTGHDDGTATLEGTPDNAAVGTYTINLLLDDGTSSTQQTYTLTVANLNTDPIATDDTAEVTVHLEPGQAADGNVLDNDRDDDVGDRLSILAVTDGTVDGVTVGQYGYLTLQADGRYHYVVDTSKPEVSALSMNSPALTERYTYTVQDSEGLTATATLSIRINGSNQAPVADATVLAEPMAARLGEAFSFVIPESAFADPEGETLTYVLGLEDSSALPDWLSFDAATRTLSGTPPVDAAVTSLNFTLTATDPEGLSARQSFVLELETGNQAPVADTTVLAEPMAARLGEAFSFVIPDTA
ncbi:MAG: putative Ig domain-containing protein, partial [Methylococcaceae bacterium]